MAVVVTKDIRNAIVGSQNNPAFKQAFADFSRACQVAQEAFVKIKNESSDACGYDDQYQFTATIANPLTGLNAQAKKEMLLEMVEEYRSHLVSNLIAQLKAQNLCTDSQESTCLSYLNGKAALLEKDEDPNSILLGKFRGFLIKIANGTLKSNSAKSDELKRKIDVLTRAMNSKMSVSFESIKPIKSKVLLESKQGNRWRIKDTHDFKLLPVQSAQDFLSYILALTEQEKTLVPYLEALSQHSSYKTLKGLQQFFGTVAESLQFLQEPIEKISLYEEKLFQLGDQAAPEKKAPITTALINAFRKGANLDPIVQVQASPTAPRAPSAKLLAKQAMIRNLVVTTPPAPQPPAAKAAIPPTIPAMPATPPPEAKVLPKQSPQPGVVPPTPPPPQIKAPPALPKQAPQNGAVLPPPPPPQVKQTIVKPSVPAPQTPPVQAVLAPIAPAIQPASLPVQAVPKPVAKPAVATKTKPRENRLLALIKKPFVGIKNLLMRLLQLFRGKKTK